MKRMIAAVMFVSSVFLGACAANGPDDVEFHNATVAVRGDGVLVTSSEETQSFSADAAGVELYDTEGNLLIPVPRVGVDGTKRTNEATIHCGSCVCTTTPAGGTTCTCTNCTIQLPN